MKTSLLVKTTSIFFILFVISIGLSEFISPAYTSTNGAPATRTGSPGDITTCTSCHSGTASAQVGLITSNIPASGYIPGTSYTITGAITVAGKTKFGFEISPQSITGGLLGTLTATDAVNTKLIGAGKYITHKTAGTAFSTGAATWSFNWTAPIAGTGDVTFYGAFLVTNSNGSTSGDICKTSTLLVNENLSAGINSVAIEKEEWDVFPNPVKDKVYFKTDLNKPVATVRLLDIRGKLIKSFVDSDIINNCIDVSFLDNGIYFLNFETDLGISTKKIIKN